MQSSQSATRPISPARIEWRQDGMPYMRAYGDTYYSAHYDPAAAGLSGAQEVERVFLAPARLSELNDRRTVIVAELGFGTGLNFLVTAEWALASGHHLKFVSFERHPLSQTDWDRATASRSRYFKLADALRQQAPPLLTGWHQRRFAEGAVTLSVYHGDVADGLEHFARSASIYVDAWFLDGFAPDRNPAMWTPSILKRIGETTRAGGSVATFTAAGRVRRALIEAGFDMRRVDQRPFKRESLAGIKTGTSPYPRPPARAVVHGAGIAGACLARHLADAGLQVDVHDPTPSRTIRQAVLHPRLLGDGTAAGAYRVSAFHYATQYLAQFEGYVPSEVLQVTADAASPEKFRTLVEFYAARSQAQNWIEVLDPEEATAAAGVPITRPALCFRAGALIDLETMCTDLLNHPNITAHTNKAEVDSSLANFLCTGVAVRDIPGLDWLELNRVDGRLHELNHALPGPKLPVVGQGYAIPVALGTVIGSTYEYEPWSDDAARARNLAANARYLPEHFQVKGQQLGSRAVSSDRNPIVGQVAENLWVSAGHGSMGTSSAPYAASILTQALLGGAPVATTDEVAMLSPQRFRARQARRGKLDR